MPSGYLKHEAQTQIDAPINLLWLAWWRSGLCLRPSQPCFPCSGEAFPQPPLATHSSMFGLHFCGKFTLLPNPQPKKAFGSLRT